MLFLRSSIIGILHFLFCVGLIHGHICEVTTTYGCVSDIDDIINWDFSIGTRTFSSISIHRFTNPKSYNSTFEDIKITTTLLNINETNNFIYAESTITYSNLRSDITILCNALPPNMIIFGMMSNSHAM